MVNRFLTQTSLLFLLFSLITAVRAESALIEKGLEIAGKRYLEGDQQCGQLISDYQEINREKQIFSQKVTNMLIDGTDCEQQLSDEREALSERESALISLLAALVYPEGRYTDRKIIHDLDDDIFDEAYTKINRNTLMFHGLDQNRIFLLEEYRKDRIPVLFVHGIFCTPRSMKPLCRQLNREKYQAWVYYYPSLKTIDENSTVMLAEIVKLKKRYGFRKIHIVAHSMGGIVTRRMMEIAEETSSDLSFLDTVMTLCSPHKGVLVKKEKTWEWLCYQVFEKYCRTLEDLRFDSDFMKKLNQKNEKCRRFIAFGADRQVHIKYCLTGKFIPEMNDGLVPTKRALPEFASHREICHEDHDSIKKNESVIAVMNSL